jgi:protein-disulfide isomerase
VSQNRRDDQPISRRDRRAQARLDRPPGPPQRAGRGGRGGRGSRATPRPIWQSPVVIVTALAAIIGIALIALATRPSTPPTGAELVTPPTSYPAELVKGDVVGAASAPVVMVLYSDFQCPACKLFVTERLPRLLTEFVVPGTLRIESRDIAILGRGTPDESLELAAGASCAAEQDRYWQFHDLVFWNQGRENRGDHDAAFIARVADAAGVDRPAWDACNARNDVRTAIKATTSTALAAGVNSTPTLVLNGQSSAGVPDYDQLAQAIRQLAAAASQAPGATAPATNPAPSPS